MLGKLMAILAHAKGAVATTVLLAGAATATVTVSSNPEVQTTFDNVTTSLSSTLSAVMQNAKKCTPDSDTGGGQPVVVAQRNAADKLLRDAWNDDHKKLVQMHGGKDVDNKAVNDVVKKYDDQLKATLDNALVKVAALTQGRDGQVRKAAQDGSASASAPDDDSRSSGAPRDGSGSAKCAPTPANAPKDSTTSNTAPRDGTRSAGGPHDGSRSAGGPKDDSDSAKGRVAVANRTTLTADLRAIVDQAVKDMDAIVKKATDEAAKLPAAPANGNKPEDKDKGKPSDKPGNGNKPSGSPRA